MTERLDSGNFFSKFYILNHQHQNLDRKDHNKALACSIALGVFTLGLVHLGCYIARTVQERGIKPGGANAGTDGKTKTATHHHFAAGPSPAPAPKAAAPPGTKEWNELVKKEFTEACGKMEKGETAKGMKSKLADALSLPRTPAQEVKIKALVKEVGLNEDDFAGTKFPHEISATVNDPASKLSGENFKKLCLGLRDILGGKAPAEAGKAATTGKATDKIAPEAPRITLEKFTQLCEDMKAGNRPPGVKSSLANALLIPRSPEQEKDFQVLLMNLNLKHEDYAYSKYNPLWSTVTLLNAGQIAGLAFGLRDILNTTPEKRAERAKEKQKEQDQTVQDFLEICKKIKAKEKVPITGTLENIIPIVAQKSPEVEKKLKDFFEKLSKQEFEWNSIARETFKRIKDNPTINRQLIALEFTNLTLEQKKNLCLEIEKEFFSK